MAKGFRKMFELPKSGTGDTRFVIVFTDDTARAYQVDCTTRELHKLTRRLPIVMVRTALDAWGVDTAGWSE